MFIVGGWTLFALVLASLVPELVKYLSYLVQGAVYGIGGVGLGAAQVLGMRPAQPWAVGVRGWIARKYKTALGLAIAWVVADVILMAALSIALVKGDDVTIFVWAFALSFNHLFLFLFLSAIGDVISTVTKGKHPKNGPLGALFGNAAIIPISMAFWHYMLGFGVGHMGWNWGVMFFVWYGGIVLPCKIMLMVLGRPGKLAPIVHFGTVLFPIILGALFAAFPQDARAVEADYALHNTNKGREARGTEIKAMGPEMYVTKPMKVFTKEVNDKGQITNITPVTVATGAIWHLNPGERFRTINPPANTIEWQSMRYNEIRLVDEDGDLKPETWLIRPENTADQVSEISIPEGSWAEADWTDGDKPGYIGKELSVNPNHLYMSREGFITYRFKSTREEAATLTATLSSELPDTTSGSFGKTSDVMLIVNGVEVNTTTVIPDDAHGHTYQFPVTMKIGQNEVKFEVKKGGKNKNGLSIYGPLRVRFQ